MQPIAPFSVLFLCTGNSARGIFGEFLMRRIGKGAFITQSAGAHPRGEVSAYTLRVLRESYHLDTLSARSKSVDQGRRERLTREIGDQEKLPEQP